MHHPTDRIAHTIAFVTPVVEHWLEREIAQCVHHEALHSGCTHTHTHAHIIPNGFYSLSLFYNLILLCGCGYF